MRRIDKEYKRRIRVNCLPGRVDGSGLDVVDAETGEPIKNILRMVIYLERSEVNECEITYHEMDDQGKIIVSPDNDFEPVEQKITVKNVEIDDLTAFEIMDSTRKRRLGVISEVFS